MHIRVVILVACEAYMRDRAVGGRGEWVCTLPMLNESVA